jgi:hypothetical protein
MAEQRAASDHRVSIDGATGRSPDFPAVEWTEDQLAKGSCIARELDDTFTTVFT